ncbi:MarR family transcriptional regulator [Cellulomonas sp. NPDC089187]|uniref:MarR family winged helix-turn-helix transcriptional regulator n=1 Tax=Cellulomonas sp. NPDC089187 TaxID=3154970 RepID=UPI00341C3F3E
MDAHDPLSRVENELGLLLRRARSQTERLSRQVHPELEPSAYPLLVRIGSHPGIRAGELASLIGIGRGTMSRQLARLEEFGLITRSPDPQDSRGQLIELTAQGADQMQRARQARRVFLSDALSDWSEQDRALFADQLARLNHDLTAHRMSDEDD